MQVPSSCARDRMADKEDKEVYSCFHCERVPAKLCLGCRAIAYCSKPCQKADWKGAVGHEGHKTQCAAFKEYALRSETLLDLGFQFPPNQWTRKQVYVRDVLKAAGATSEAPESSGLWPFEHKNFVDARGGVTRAQLEEICAESDPAKMVAWVFGDVAVPLRLEGLRECAETATGWEDVFKSCGLPMTSPAALILHHTLTIFWILKKAKQGKPVESVHILGAEQEVFQIPIILPVLQALLNRPLNLLMLGPEIPPAFNNFKASVGQVTATVKCQTAKYMPGDPSPGERIPPPDLAIALNAGIGAYPDWQWAIAGVGTNGVPFLCTDYMEYSAANGTTNLKQLALQMPASPNGRALAMEPELNPFRQPLDRRPDDSRRSWRVEGCGNAYIFGYSSYS